MALFSTLTAQLAFQVDKKILALEEEDYVRLDLSAHEHVGSRAIALPKPNFLKSARQFAVAAMVIYLILFSITNAQAYSKILMANVEQIIIQRDALLTPATLEPMQTDPWTGDRVAAEPETALTAFEGETVAEDGLLNLALIPTSYENRLSIPSLDINAPIVEPTLGVDALVAKDWNTLEDQIRSTLLQGIVHYPGTAKPGKVGNAFFTGHSSNVFWEPSPYNTVFALLPKIEVGADVYITYDQKEFHYRVTDKYEVEPTDVSILKQGDEETLTLVTCTPVGTTLRRLVVTAELL